MSRLSFGCPRSGDSMGIPQMTMGVSHCGHEDIPGHPRGWSHMGLPYVSYVSSVPVLGDIPGHPWMVPHGATLCVLCLKCPSTCGHPRTSNVPHGATLCVLCLKCPSTWGHPRTSRGWSHMGLLYVSYVSSVPVLGDIPGHPEDGPTWGYPMCKCPSTWGHPRTSRGWSHMGLPYVSYVSSVPVLGDIPGHPEDGPTWGYPTCPMSQVSQYLGTSQDIPRMVPHGATLCVLCLKCPSTWGHPRTSSVPHGATVRVLCLKCPSTWGHPRTSRGWSHMGLPYVSYVSSVPVLGDIPGHPMSHMGLPYVSYVSVLGDIPGHPEDGPTWGYPMCPMSQVSQYLERSQDIPGMVPHGATQDTFYLACWPRLLTRSSPLHSIETEKV